MTTIREGLLNTFPRGKPLISAQSIRVSLFLEAARVSVNSGAPRVQGESPWPPPAPEWLGKAGRLRPGLPPAPLLRGPGCGGERGAAGAAFSARRAFAGRRQRRRAAPRTRAQAFPLGSVSPRRFFSVCPITPYLAGAGTEREAAARIPAPGGAAVGHPHFPPRTPAGPKRSRGRKHARCPGRGSVGERAPHFPPPSPLVPGGGGPR